MKLLFLSVFLIGCVVSSHGRASSPIEPHIVAVQQGSSAQLHDRQSSKVGKPSNNAGVEADKEFPPIAPISNRGLHGRNRRHRTKRQAGSSSTAGIGESVMALIANLMRESGFGGGSGVNGEVEFSSGFGRTMNSVFTIVRNQANALLHLLRALAPLDGILADNNWRLAQTAMMRQETASTFNIIMDLLLQVVRGIMRLFGGMAY
ncbi:unnamed protein product [Notodromas monacha]|uniref:Uncharacterized protein n=1 Tax=Notodromas monacha TaxID=399045 RepID=A0A7R9BFG3_9CRUS|nr:unnamed protein product [Notodromas monacha]CAG0913813.1 unnamed protein product [Notodromas monacha]